VSAPRIADMRDLSRLLALEKLAEAVKSGPRYGGLESDVTVSAAWLERVLAAAQAVPPRPGHFVCPGCGCVDRFGSYMKDGVLTGYCNGRDSSLVGCPARFSWVRNPEEDRKVGLADA